MLQSINPYNGEVLKNFETFTEAEIEVCLHKAAQAFETWQETTLAERVESFTKLAHLLRTNSGKLATLISTEMGKPIKESKAEIAKCVWTCEYYAFNAAKFLQKETCTSDAKNSYVSFEPLGCLLAIMPWNFPFWQVFRFAVPALIAGNVALLKHAPNTTLCGLEIAQLFIDAGFPIGVFQSLVIENEQVENIIAHSTVKAVTLTGSEIAGSKVATIAGKYLKKTVLELGGSDAFIVFADADLSAASEVAVHSRMLNSGQSCIAAKRFIVAAEVYDRFVQLIKQRIARLNIGNPLDEETEVGVIARADLLQNLHRQVTESVAKGATLVAGGTIKGNFYAPTLLADVKAGMPVFDEEVFGGVFAVCRFDTETEALALANQTKYGLAASIWTRQPEKAELLSKKLVCGAVFINALVRSDPRLPFGGVKNSGYGRELSHYGIREFVNVKTIFVG